MQKFIYNKDGHELASITIHGDRIKKFDREYFDGSVEAFVYKNNEKKVHLELDEEFEVVNVGRFSNERKNGITHELICDKLPLNSNFIKLNYFESFKVKYNTRKFYFRTSSFKNEVFTKIIIVLITAAITAAISNGFCDC